MPLPIFLVMCHNQLWLIMINLQILSWKITNNHQKSPNITKYHEKSSWNIWLFHFRSPKSWKMFHLTWWFFLWIIMIYHDSQISVERGILARDFIQTPVSDIGKTFLSPGIFNDPQSWNRVVWEYEGPTSFRSPKFFCIMNRDQGSGLRCPRPMVADMPTQHEGWVEEAEIGRGNRNLLTLKRP